jgi:hypothetical protein
MLQAMSAPAHNDRHPQRKIQAQRLMNNTQSTANDRAKGDHLESTAGQMPVTQFLNHVLHKAQAAVTVEREDRFRMKLDGLHRQFAMADAHDHAVLALGRDFETAG